jgi:hypothetical protein
MSAPVGHGHGTNRKESHVISSATADDCCKKLDIS